MLRRTPPVAFATLPILALLALGGCGDDSTGPSGPGTVVIQFDNTVDGQPLQMNNQIYTNAAGNVYAVSNLEYVISDIHLHPVDHNDPEYDATAPHYRTEADPTTRTVTYADVPAGDYHQLGFTFGITGEDNVSGAYPELDAVGMAWPAQMGGGYHNMRCEGTYDGTNGFLTHTGPSMGNDYSVDYTLETVVHVATGQTTVITVQMNVNEWYTTPNVYDFADHGAIMGDAAAQLELQQNGADAFSILSVTTE